MPIIIPDDLPYTPYGIECLRLGARRGGVGIGCCAVDVFQGFNNSPSAMCPPIPFFNGDCYSPEFGDFYQQLAMHGTNEQVFLAYLAHGSFTPYQEPDHAFIAVLTDSQCRSETGKQWLRILKREGFEWKGCVNNSVYSEYHPNHIFMLIRNTREHLSEDELKELSQPPQAWEELGPPNQTPEERYVELCRTYTEAHIEYQEEQ